MAKRKNRPRIYESSDIVNEELEKIKNKKQRG